MKKFKFPITIVWPKKHEQIKPVLNTTKILINGILLTCIGLSIVSGLIDIVFFSGLSKSFYGLFGIWSIPAGVVLSVMSLFFTSAKFWCAMQLGAIGELQARLRNAGFNWWKNLNKLKIKWHLVHKFLISISIITSVSLSVVSIGAGITRNANTLKQIDDFIVQGTRYSELVNQANNTTLNTIVKKSVDTSEDDAIRFTNDYMQKIRPLIEDYKDERNTFISEYGAAAINSLEIEFNGKPASQYWTEKNSEINSLLSSAGYGTVLSGPRIFNLNLAAVEQTIKQNYLTTHKPKNADEVNASMNELKDSTLEEAAAWIQTLNSIGFTKNVQTINEDGKKVWKTVPIEFDVDPKKSTKVLVDTALTQLKAFRVDVENDAGDIGESSKIFMQVGSWIDKINAKSTSSIEEALTVNISTGMGPTEVMMMVLIMIFGIVQEFIIALFTPKSTIDRKMLSRFDAYFGPMDVNRFLLSVYSDYLNKGIINQKDFEAKAKKCVELMNDTVDDVIARYSKKHKPESNTSKQRMSTPVLKVEKAEIPVRQLKEEKHTATSEKEQINATPQYSSDVTNLISEIEGLI